MTCRGEGPQQLMDFHVVIPWHSCVHLVALLLDVVFPSCLHPFPGVAVCGRVSMINGDIARPGRDLNRDWPAENGFTVDDCSDCFPACLCLFPFSIYHSLWNSPVSVFPLTSPSDPKISPVLVHW